MKKLLLWLMAAVFLLPVATACSDDKEHEPWNGPCESQPFIIGGVISYDSINSRTIIVSQADSAYNDYLNREVYGKVYVPESDKFFNDNNEPVNAPVGSVVYGEVEHLSSIKDVVIYNGKPYEGFEVALKYVNLETNPLQREID